jgi:hypothetical protein
MSEVPAQSANASSSDSHSWNRKPLLRVFCTQHCTKKLKFLGKKIVIGSLDLQKNPLKKLLEKKSQPQLCHVGV